MITNTLWYIFLIDYGSLHFDRAAWDYPSEVIRAFTGPGISYITGADYFSGRVPSGEERVDVV